MTLITISRPLLLSEICRRYANHIVTSGSSRLSEWRARARSRRELRQLSEFDLQDIGWTRAGAVGEAAKAFWRA
ncbi:MAG: DUF1127 domain-containing protein [Xanthobacteraceae bacterium]|jgi:uncharacterized protein YjiS (DUF1127 family)